MKRSIRVFLLLAIPHAVRTQEVNALSELPFAELLTQKRIVEEIVENAGKGIPAVSASTGTPPPPDVDFKGLHRKTFYDEDYDDDKGHVHKKKEEHKIHDLFNTSIMALSYLAFGGYLLCMIASALREKRRRIALAYPTAGAATNGHFAQVLQHHVTHRPSRPFVRFPAVTVHQGGKKRRRRSSQKETPLGAAEEGPPLFDVTDYIEALAHGGN